MIYLTDILTESLFGGSLKMKSHEKLMANAVVSFMNDKFNMKPTIIVKKKDKDGYGGNIVLSDTAVKKKRFYLYFNPNYSYKDIIRIMLHELTHVKQVYKGELLPSSDDKFIMWKGKEYISVTDYKRAMRKGGTEYMNFPWEVEAEQNMKKLYNKFIRSKHWQELKGEDPKLDAIIDKL